MSDPKFDFLYLHVGRHKTGTSALQKFFLLNEKTLLKNGFLYPALKRSPFSGTHHMLFNPIHPFKSKKSKRSEFYKNMNLLQQLAKEEMDLLLSTELLSELKDISPLEELKKIASHVKIIIYLRRQDTYVESAYSQVIKGGRFSGTIKEYASRPMWQNNINYKESCDRWADVFGKENIVVKPYERRQFKGENLFLDFLSILGIDSLDGFVIPRQIINPSLTQDALHFKRYANKLISDKFIRRELGDSLSVKSLQKGTVKPFQNHSLLSPSDKIELLEKFKESNALVAYEYLNRDDRILFYDPLPQLDDDWLLYPGLNKDTILEIANYIYVMTPDLFEILASGIRDGLNSQNSEIYNAANMLKPVLELTNKITYRIMKPLNNFWRLFRQIKNSPLKSFLENHPNIYAFAVRVYQKVMKDSGLP